MEWKFSSLWVFQHFTFTFLHFLGGKRKKSFCFWLWLWNEYANGIKVHWLLKAAHIIVVTYGAFICGILIYLGENSFKFFFSSQFLWWWSDFCFILATSFIDFLRICWLFDAVRRFRRIFLGIFKGFVF